jgi:SAM-dependent methyltransferase
LLLFFGFRNNSIRRNPERDRIRYSFTTSTTSTTSTTTSLQATEMSSSSSNSPLREGNDFSKKAEQKWSRAANSYVRYFEPMTVVAGRFLLGLLKMRFQQQQQGLKVLEAGCGAGGLAKELLLDASSPSSSLSISELVLTDLSDGMLDRARVILTDIITNGNDNNSSTSGVPQIRLEQADFTAFDRQKFPDGYFDRYYTNLCLHYAENPDDVIREASRVLKACDGRGENGGIAGFTVWGRRADSPVMTIVPDILEGFCKKGEPDDKQQQQKRSPFHLGEDDEGLRQRFLRDGIFSKCTVLHYPAVLESLDVKDYVEAILDGAPSTKKELEEEYSEEDQETIRRMVHEKAMEILSKGEPLVLDMAMVVAQK